MPPIDTARNPPFRADQVGSLVRPTALLLAREDFATGKLDAASLRAAEDTAIRAAVAKQEEIGLAVVTDGEFRRETYSDSFTVAGVTGITVILTEDAGWTQSETHGHRMARRIPSVTGRIEWRGPQNAKDFAVLRASTKRTPKITLPGPGYIHYRAGRAHISRDIYPNLDDFWSDLIGAYRREIRSLYEAGCRYLQIDETSLVKLGDPRVRQLLKERGDDWRDLLRLYIDAINVAIADAPADMRTAIHICRSQDPNWQADTGYDPIAEAMFNRLNIETYLLEYDNARTGGFEPLKLLPPGKAVVLGLIASRNARMETSDELKRRVDEASRFAPIERLALAPQCGFATSADRSSAEAEALQWRKLALLVETATAIWGGDD